MSWMFVIFCVCLFDIWVRICKKFFFDISDELNKLVLRYYFFVIIYL